MNFDFELDPFENFLKSIHEAETKSQSLSLSNYNAMALTTVKDNKPSSRMVLYKGLVRRGFSFFTHYDGRKGSQIKENNHVAAVFYWPYLNHQINIQGQAYPLNEKESDLYFQSRDRASQIGAWASDQSQVMNSRDEFETKVKLFEDKFKDIEIPRPKEWGGFHIIPAEIEFWFQREARQHDRFVYQTDGENWKRFVRYP
ncbi:MAG: pyridoxamine 5'-phosphate oxidase [Bdellovibrionaceae bacterium]|nr:pyridoxamine 5'-phosphate oxidase [Pseudobdellovibrionaceae bacterium]